MNRILEASLQEGYRREAKQLDAAIEAYNLLSDKSTEYAKALGVLIDVHNKAASVYRNALGGKDS